MLPFGCHRKLGLNEEQWTYFFDDAFQALQHFPLYFKFTAMEWQSKSIVVTLLHLLAESALSVLQS